MKKKIISALVVCTMTASMLIGCGSGKDGSGSSNSGGEERVWKFAHTRAEGTENDVIARDFADNLTSSIDNLKIDIYPNNQLGDYTVVQEATGMNEVQLMFGSMSPTVDSTLSVQIAPYLVSNWDEAKELYNSEDGAMYKYVEERLVDQNIKLLAVVPKYFGSIMATGEINNIDDPTAKKGMKIRVPQQNAFEKFASTIGFSATPLPTADTFTALQTGVVEAVSGGGVEQYFNDYGELCKAVYCMRTHMECHWIYMSMETWDSLSEEEQKIVTKYAKEVEEKAFATAPENEEQYIKKFEEKGVTVYQPEENVIEAYTKYVREKVWPEIAADYGDAWEEITSHIE